MISAVDNNNGQQWTTMDNNGQQWTTMDNNGQQWITMDNNGQQWTTNSVVLPLSIFGLGAIHTINSHHDDRYNDFRVTSGRHAILYAITSSYLAS